MKKTMLSVFAFFFLFLAMTYAQNETGVRYLNDSIFKSAGYWYDSTNSMYQKQLPIIRSIPPITTGMPYDVLMSYIYLDSLLRFSTTWQQNELLRTWTSANDTLTNAIKYLYKIKDYDPIVFNQYMGEVALNHNSAYGGRYESSLIDLNYNLSNKIKSLIPDNKKNAFFALLFADYILRVQVVYIDSMPNKQLLSGIKVKDSNVYCVYARVLDTIKGKKFKDLNNYSENNILKNKISLNPSIQEPIISFEYIKRIYYQRPYYPNTPYMNIENDDAFKDENGEFSMHVGQEAIVFLKYANQLFDFENDYFSLILESTCSNSALPINDEKVKDINLIWNNDNLIEYDSWKQNITDLIEQILNGSY